MHGSKHGARNPLQARRRGSGFTLIEILVAMVIFLIGGTAILALFITNARLSAEAMDFTRAAEITRNVRSLMTTSLSRPIFITEENVIYQFYYPEASLTFQPRDYMASQERPEAVAPTDINAVGGTAIENTIFFCLPTARFDATALTQDRSDMVTRLPSDARDPAGRARDFRDGDPFVFRFKPDRLRRAGAVDMQLDPDDRMFYQFDIVIRRSVARSSVQDPRTGVNRPLDDLFVVTVRVYRNYEFHPDVISDPFYEWDFYVNATR